MLQEEKRQYAQWENRISGVTSGGSNWGSSGGVSSDDYGSKWASGGITSDSYKSGISSDNYKGSSNVYKNQQKETKSKLDESSSSSEDKQDEFVFEDDKKARTVSKAKISKVQEEVFDFTPQVKETKSVAIDDIFGSTDDFEFEEVPDKTTNLLGSSGSFKQSNNLIDDLYSVKTSDNAKKTDDLFGLYGHHNNNDLVGSSTGNVFNVPVSNIWHNQPAAGQFVYSSPVVTNTVPKDMRGKDDSDNDDFQEVEEKKTVETKSKSKLAGLLNSNLVDLNNLKGGLINRKQRLLIRLKIEEKEEIIEVAATEEVAAVETVGIKEDKI